MPDKQPFIAKLTRPDIIGVVQRENLFSLMNGLKRPIIWITGPPGSGKTTLASSWIQTRNLPCLWYKVDNGDSDIASFFYRMGLAAKKANPRKKKPMPLLTPEYALGIPAFTRNFFEELFGRLMPSSSSSSSLLKRGVIVLDDYQEAAPDSPFHEVIKNGLELMPEGHNILCLKAIILSRAEPPPQFIGLKASQKIAFIGWDELRFDLDETMKLISLTKTAQALSAEAARQICSKTGGWAAGITLLLELAREGALPPVLSTSVAAGDIFDYFAEIILKRVDKETQDFLLKTAFLPDMTLQMAEELTGNERSGQILSWLVRSNMFIRESVKGASYQYHQLFREFLIQQASISFTPEDLSNTKRSAAGLLAKAGRVEDAISLYIEDRDWNELAPLIMPYAPSLLMQGRNRVLETWITAMPDELLNNNPWLLYWLGLCRLPINNLQSRENLEKTFYLFDKQKDAAGAFLSWRGIIDTYVLVWSPLENMDFWIDILYKLMDKYKKFPSPEIEVHTAAGMFSALSHYCPGHKDMKFWDKRARELMQTCPDNNLRTLTYSIMINYYSWVGDYAGMTTAYNELRHIAKTEDVSPLTMLMWRMCEAMYHWVGGSFDLCLEAVDKAVKTAEDSGVHMVDTYEYAQGVYAALFKGDLELAAAFLKKVGNTVDRQNSITLSHYKFLSAILALSKGDIKLAVSLGEENLSLNLKNRVFFATAISHAALANAYIEAGEYKKAEAHLSEVLKMAGGMNSMTLEYQCLLSHAHIAMEKGDEKKGLEYMKKALSLTREMGFVNIFFTRRQTMSRLCAKALEAGIETGQAEEIIRRFRLTPPEANGLDSWPYPLKIYTLGGFEIFKDGRPLSFSGKGQKSPLTLLKAIIALGGKGVRAERLTDAVWPDADGDTAYISLKTTLHRLRQVLGNEKAISFNEGRVSLDAQCCWPDVWAFERISEDFEALFKSALRIPNSEISSAEKAVALYKGHFLSGEKEYLYSWAVSKREALKDKFMRLVGRLGNYYEREGMCDKAIEYYNKAIETDDLQKEFYQKLMLCYHSMGRQSDAVRIYRRCCSTLESVLGVKPSPETERIYKKVMGKG